MADVGRLADVSAQTVSRYFTGSGYVSADTRDRIEAAVAELGYRPNLVARNMRSSRTNTIGVMTMGPLVYGKAGVLTGLSTAARASHYTLLITQIEQDLDEPGAMEEALRALETFQSFRVDGILLGTPYPNSEQLFEGITDTLPVITISSLPRAPKDAVVLDSYQAGLRATQHLIDLGHRRIVHASGPPNRNETQERERGYLDAMRDAGLEPLPPLAGTDWSGRSGYDAGMAVDPADFTAVFASSDLIALGFLSAMRSRGFTAPADYSIVGVDDMPDCAFYDPPLTSMRMDFQLLGSLAFEMMMRHITTGKRPDRLLLPTELVMRESTAPPRDDN